MINRFLISAAAVALIASAPTVYAQGNANREGGAATQQTAPSGNAGGAATEKNAPGGMKSTQSEQKSPGAAKGQRAEENAPGQKPKGMSSENETKGAAGNMKSEGREDRDKNMKAEGRNTNTNANVTTGQAGAGAKLSSEQRTKITTVIRNEHVAPVTNIDFSVSVGTRVPRERVSLRVLPTEVVTIYPEWRGYEFFLVRDEIVVVDPRTLEIVAVLPA